MAMLKSGYKDQYTGTTSFKVAIDSDGYLTNSSDTPAGTKRISFNKVNADNDLQANEQVIDFFLGMIDAQHDQYSNQMTVRWEADENA